MGRHFRSQRSTARSAAARHDGRRIQRHAGASREGLIMAKIVGGIATSHIPSIGKAIARGLVHDPDWKSFFDGFAPVHRWLDEVRPDVAVVVYNDHGLNFFLDKMPTFAV